jgi:uncharacterized membrane protein YeaQ/YmgE (transglycosylase-associated protein family)
MNSTALLYVLGVIVCWGLYSVFLHMGSMGMKGAATAADPMANRMKAFLLVGIAYFLIAIVGPLLVLKSRATGAEGYWHLPFQGWTLSFVAGLLGAVGAFFLLMALSSGRSPGESKQLIALVPTLVFAGAPLVNAVVSVTKEHLWAKTPWQFFAGLILAAVGAGLVMFFKPSAGPPPAKPTPTSAAVDVTSRHYHVS